MMRAREDRIRTFMQLELEACLEEDSWSIRCYYCTRSGELETPPKSPAIGTGLNRPGVSPAIEADSPQTEESLFPPETNMEGFLNFNFLSPEQECTLHQPGIGVEYNDEATSKLQAGAREESARPPIRQ